MNPDLLALDFDGVLCDGLLEYFAVARQTHQQLWQRTEPIAPEIADRFYPLRPAIETGWEMPVLIQALVEDRSPTEILQNWRSIATEIIQRDRLEPAQLSQQLDGNRDRWIAGDLDGWLDLHRFFPGTINRLQAILASAETELVIITTKEERFVRQLLDRAGVDHQAIAIFGKATQRPKAETLKQWLGQKAHIWFVEDMLPTLHKVAREPMLDQVQLFLADWGYNTASDRASIVASDRIRLLSLDRFAQPFGDWLAQS